VLGEYLQSALFPRAKYELYALQHMQLLAWLQRVQSGLSQGVGKTGPDGITFLQQIAHAARVLLFQPLIVHMHQVMLTVSSLPGVGSDEVPSSMRQAMTYPADTATDADRVEWLQLNLLLQFQTVYKSALCNTSIYQNTCTRRAHTPRRPSYTPPTSSCMLSRCSWRLSGLRSRRASWQTRRASSSCSRA
jgi:hypothetical protein